MNLEEFEQQYNNAPIDMLGIACLIHSDLDLEKDISFELYHAAADFMSAYNRLSDALRRANIKLR